MPKNITEKGAINFIREITQGMNQSDDPTDVLNRILAASIETTGADSGSIMLIDAESRTLQTRAAIGLPYGVDTMVLKLGEGVTGWVAANGKGRIVNDTAKEKDYISLKEGLLSELAVPMVMKGEVIGVLSVDSSQKDAFLGEHEEFLSIMSNLAAKIFMNLNDNRLLKLRERSHRVLLDVSEVILKSTRLEDVFRDIMTITEKAFRLYRSMLLLYDNAEDCLKVAASVGLSRDEVQSVSYMPGEGVTGSVFMNRRPVYIPDVAEEPDFLNRTKTFSDQEHLGFYCCPIFSSNEVVGVFSTFTTLQDESTGDSLLEFLEILGSIISQAITIQNLIKEEKKIVELENLRLRDELASKYHFGNMIGKSSRMSTLFEKIRQVADSRSSVLITGESGTGKELIASAIHYNSPRKDGPFIKLNCAAIPENLFESELFGYRKGAFTGALSDRKGKFELADGGTIFLDEIGEMDLNLQSKLLRVLQEREIEPVGGKVKKVDVRVIVATNADLLALVKEKKFRQDLYYRLNVINLMIPALRERVEDILPLTLHFIKKYSIENNKNIESISPDALHLLEHHDWPGNVRELENAVERAIVLGNGSVLKTDDFEDILPSVQRDAGESKEIAFSSSGMELPVDNLEGLDGRAYASVIEEVERRLILVALKRFRYTKTRTAKFLGINRNTLDKKIKELDIHY